MNKPWILECNEVPGWNTKECCPSCHEDAAEAGIEACAIEIDNNDLQVCCKVVEDYNKITVNIPCYGDADYWREYLKEIRVETHD